MESTNKTDLLLGRQEHITVNLKHQYNIFYIQKEIQQVLQVIVNTTITNLDNLVYSGPLYFAHDNGA